MSFAEIDYRHQVLCVELAGESLLSVTEVVIPRAVELLRIPKQAAPVDEVLAQLLMLDLPLTDVCRHPYLEVRVKLDKPEPGLRARIEAALDGKPVRLTRIETSLCEKASDKVAAMSLDDLNRLRPDDIFKRLYESRYGTQVPDAQLAAFEELFLESDLIS
jgi:exonuclease SbcD